jgi:hypothetical protein
MVGVRHERKRKYGGLSVKAKRGVVLWCAWNLIEPTLRLG